jgi:hypothetical protein
LVLRGDDLEATKKLQGAAYHLQRMEEFYLKDEKKFTHELVIE